MNYIICFWDKSKLQVSGETGEKLKQAITAETIKTFELGANLYAVGGVEKIITKDDAYDIFPIEFEHLKAMENKIIILPQLENPKNKLLNKRNNL